MGTVHIPFPRMRMHFIFCFLILSRILFAQSVLWHYLHAPSSSGYQIGKLSDGNTFVVGNEPDDSLRIKIFSDQLLISNIGLPDNSYKYSWVGMDIQSGKLLFLNDHRKLIGIEPYSGITNLIFDFKSLDTGDFRIQYLHSSKNELLFRINPLSKGGTFPNDPYFLILDRVRYNFKLSKVKDRRSFSFAGIFGNGDWLFQRYDYNLNRLEFLKVDTLDQVKENGYMNINYSSQNIYGSTIDGKDRILVWGDTAYFPNRLHRAFLKVMDENLLLLKSIQIGPSAANLSRRIFFRPLKVLETDDRGYLIVGDKAEFVEFGNYTAWFYRLDADFDKIWELGYAPPGFICSAKNAIELSSDKWLAVGGCSTREGFYFFEDRLLVLSLDGSVTRTSNFTNQEYFVQPVPVTDVLRLNKPLDYETDFSIVNFQGMKVSFGEWSGQVNVSTLPPGVYQLILRRDSLPLLFRFVKI